MKCVREQGHKGKCVAGDESGGCKKTAAKWFEVAATFDSADDVLTQEEVETMNEQQLAMAYRRTYHPSTRKEAVAWAREQIARRKA